jgi:hypothetical protein
MPPAGLAARRGDDGRDRRRRSRMRRGRVTAAFGVLQGSGAVAPVAVARRSGVGDALTVCSDRAAQ